MARWGRDGILGSLFPGTAHDEKELRDASEYFREEAVLDKARADYGITPGSPSGGAPDVEHDSAPAPGTQHDSASPAPVVTDPQSEQARLMADPGGMVDATGMDDAMMARAEAASAASAAPAGWYADPERPGAMRYWSGAAWSPSGVTPPGVSPPPG